MFLLEGSLLLRWGPLRFFADNQVLSEPVVLDCRAQILQVVPHDVELISAEELLLDRPLHLFVLKPSQ